MDEVSNFLARTSGLECGCLEWTGPVINTGYGTTRFRGKRWLAHRASYELFVGPIPAGLVIDHLCGNKLCVNPAHLEAVTQRENVCRAPLGGTSAANALKTHCPSGHPYDAEHARITARGRVCRVCDNEASRRYRRRKKAERV